MKPFDMIVLGAGSGGLTIASFMNRAGFKVLLVDRSAEHVGGDCLNYGCVPSKALIHAARAVRAARGGAALGVSAQGESDMAAVRAYIRDAQGLFRAHENPAYLRGKGIEVALGEAVFVDRDAVRVGEQTYRGKKIVIATGSRPRPYVLPGGAGTRVHTNESIFSLESVPKRLVCIGGGPISLEIGQAFRYLGAEVAIVHSGREILGKEDPRAARRLREALTAEGIEFYCGARPRGASSAGLAVVQYGEERTIPFDTLFAAVGRVLNTDMLDLAVAGIKTRGGVIVSDAFLRTSNPLVYVCGDAAGGHQFTHAAEMHASVILHNLFSPFKRRVRPERMSWVTYTNPELATFGRSEASLLRARVPHETLENDFGEDDRAMIDGYRGYARLLLSPKGLLLGGTMLAPHAGELVQELTLAQMAGIPLDTLSEKVYPYPVAARINRALSLARRARRLTPFSKRLLKVLFNLLH